jgi:hypothetical protein
VIQGLDVASDVTQYASFFISALQLLVAPQEDYSKVGLLSRARGDRARRAIRAQGRV